MKKREYKLFLYIVILLFSGIRPVSADIYKYVDENGILHFTDSPTKKEVVLYIKKPENYDRDKYYSPDSFNEIILKASQKNGVSYSLIKAIIKVESNFNPKAVSRVGAVGLMQIMPENLKQLNIKNPYNPYENIMGGTLYFRKLLERFDGQLILALAAYNAGPTVVLKYNNIPPYKETQNFVNSVIRYNYKYK
jgi:soluble lytic murein transglycosylase-like protein